MRLTIFFIAVFFAWQPVLAQTFPARPPVSPITFDKYFKDTLTFTKKWDYTWFVVADDSGANLENTLGGPLTKTDTIHLHHTANCWTNHQGRHHVRYCNAISNNDTINLIFQPELPAYASQLTVSITDNYFWSDFSATYPAQAGKLSWFVTRQKLVLDKNIYQPGDTIKGYLDLEFTEVSSELNKKPSRKKYYYKGYFKTPLLKGD